MSSHHGAPGDDGSTEALAHLARLVDGGVTIGEREPILLLLTADPDGYPRQCALSRTELDIAGRFLGVALHARRTVANLERDGVAVLIAVDHDEIVTFRLIVERVVRRDGLVGVRFEIVGMESDSLGIELSPPTFVPTAELARSEHWDASRRLLAALRESTAG